MRKERGKFVKGRGSSVRNHRPFNFHVLKERLTSLDPVIHIIMKQGNGLKLELVTSAVRILRGEVKPITHNQEIPFKNAQQKGKIILEKSQPKVYTLIRKSLLCNAMQLLDGKNE